MASHVQASGESQYHECSSSQTDLSGTGSSNDSTERKQQRTPYTNRGSASGNLLSSEQQLSNAQGDLYTRGTPTGTVPMRSNTNNLNPSVNSIHTRYQSNPKMRQLGRTRSATPRATDSPPPPPPTWRKVLYERQPFEDNYVDPLQFLQELRQNENVKNYRYGDVVVGTFAIIQQISVVVLFVYVFAKVFTGEMRHYSLLCIDVAIILVAWILYVLIQKESEREQDAATEAGDPHGSVGAASGGAVMTEHPSTWAHMWGFLRQVVSLCTTLVLLSPILRTLTVAYYDDTIVALSVLTMSLHVLTADYSYLNAYTKRYQPNLSMNAATFGVILMASRIQSPLESGSLIAFGAICFSLSPIARHLLRLSSISAHVGVTCLLFGLSAGCLLQVPILAIFYVVSMALVAFVIPRCFVELHSSVKYQINGPWDEAKPTNSAAAAEWANAGLLR